MKPTLRYATHMALLNLEWIERHVIARPDVREVRERLVDEIDDLRCYLIGRLGAEQSKRKRVRTSPLPTHTLVVAPTDRTYVELPGTIDTQSEQ